MNAARARLAPEPGPLALAVSALVHAAFAALLLSVPAPSAEVDVMVIEMVALPTEDAGTEDAQVQSAAGEHAPMAVVAGDDPPDHAPAAVPAPLLHAEGLLEPAVPMMPPAPPSLLAEPPPEPAPAAVNAPPPGPAPEPAQLAAATPEPTSTVAPQSVPTPVAMPPPIAPPRPKPVARPTASRASATPPSPSPSPTTSAQADAHEAAPTGPHEALPRRAASPAELAAAAPAQPMLVLHPRFREPPRPPVYPPRARELDQQGEVVVRALIDEEGNAAEIEVWRSSGYPILDRAAREAVRRWAFEPARRNNQPVRAWVQVPVRFALR